MVLPSNLAPSAMDALLSCHGDHVFFFFFLFAEEVLGKKQTSWMCLLYSVPRKNFV